MGNVINSNDKYAFEFEQIDFPIFLKAEKTLPDNFI